MSPNNARLRELVLVALRKGRSEFLDACPYPALIPRAVNIGDLQRSHSDNEGDTMQYTPTVSDVREPYGSFAAQKRSAR